MNDDIELQNGREKRVAHSKAGEWGTLLSVSYEHNLAFPHAVSTNFKKLLTI